MQEKFVDGKFGHVSPPTTLSPPVGRTSFWGSKSPTPDLQVTEGEALSFSPSTAAESAEEYIVRKYPPPHGRSEQLIFAGRGLMR